MKMLKALGIAITLLLLMLQAVSAQAPQCTTKNADYDAVRDFSIQANPNGVWSYGWESTLGAPLTLYTVPDTNCYPGFGISVWHEEGPCDLPYVAHNDTDKQICYGSFCVPPTYLQLHPGRSGELTVLRWTAPSSGKFLMQTIFVGLDCCTTSTYVHVQLNSKRSFLKAPITSYQWPLSFKPRPLALSAGDTLDFIVDQGINGNYNNDSTGVEVKIWSEGQH
ncbi:MAG: hypothetical protein WB952_06510 [Terriglobales bacterium]